MIRRRALPLALLATVGLLVAACSGSDEAADTTAADTTAAAETTVATTAAPDSTAVDTTTPGTTAPSSTVPLATGMVTFTKAIDGLDKPVDVMTRPDDPTLYVVEQSGRVVMVKDGTLAGTALDISSKISTGNEQGLLGLAFHPDLRLAYIDYTNADGDTIIAEFAVAADGTLDAGSEREVLKVDQPYPNHNGGKVTFGPDDLLYLSFGDGGSGGDPQRNAQNLSSPLGKILRIDPRASGDQPYTVPDDNPFAGQSGAAPLVWAYGLRNPWRFDFDRETGDLWIADVGQNAWEEVDVALASAGGGRGVNFGWSAMEGNHRFNEDQDPSGAQAPIWEYAHGDDGCSVSGGTVYRGSDIPSLVGAYVVADYCSGNVWALQPSADATTANVVPLGIVTAPSAVVSGPDGKIWVLSHGDGALYLATPA